ncbi:helix-turn-helix domain-containing protein [Pelagicoccus sp. NFK12]|uniref:Helix-turn-helix domain-containing protein n=1 Tax=Pelagicoccus enzymogenes TaxID=2773457 RepID=A0A927F512_9BACT|nr:helix-turn-helix domain-containing protein [Pelagicoccus enzymogenes]MBD5778009.1 helix-turn-helix domain-containing protein [Pelagicoccus enzymogenes]MDQ8197935.1 helix-turn-helix domain-containing protein [Pelagicoccus enzymogenes]
MQSIGERLEEARKRKGVTIREAAEATKIRGDYLNSFENNNFQINVPDIYVRGFLRSYCNFLKVNSEKVITDYNAELLGEAKAAKREHREFFGRMELQHTPLVNEETKSAPKGTATIDDDKLRAEEEEDEKVSFLDKIDKEAAIKIGIVAVVAIMFLLVIVWLFRTLTSGGIDDGPQANTTGLVPTQQTASAPAETAPAAATETITLIATGDVRVSVTERNTGKVLLDYFPMVAGQREAIQKSGPVKIDYTAGENLQVEIKGTAYGTGKTGQNYSTIP